MAAKTGRIAVAKKAEKGTYAIKVRITSKKTANHKAASRTVKVKLKIK